MRLVVGLGNPGTRYSFTRHNVGWMVVEELAEEEGAGFRAQDDCAEVARLADALVAKPTTYMNESGLAVAALKSFYKLAPESILIVYDDVNLPLGMVRVRAAGSSGGHNGLASIIERLGTQEFPRLRLGIGPKPSEFDMRDFVLSQFRPDETDPLDEMLDEAVKAVRLWLEEGTVQCMNAFNRRIGSEESQDAESDRASSPEPERRSPS